MATHGRGVPRASGRCRLYEAVETTDGKQDVVGVCYVMLGTEPNSSEGRSEFGGVFVRDDCRKFGLGTALGILSITNAFAYEPPNGRLIAHVHEFNQFPRRMLTEQLGFVRDGEEIPPDETAPKQIQRNDDGQVVGHLFAFQRTKLADFATWIEAFDDTLQGSGGKVELKVELAMMRPEQRADTVTALRDSAR